jgi:hypothetical protein
MAAPQTTVREWVFTAAQTDALLLTVGSTEKAIVTYVNATCANSNSVDVAVRIGFASGSTLPSITNNDLTGNAGVFFSHGAIARGGGAVAGPAAHGGALAVGALGEDIRITCSAPTGGSLRIVMQYRILVDQDQVG